MVYNMYPFKVEFLLLILALCAMECDAGFDLRHPGRLETSQFGVKPADKKCHNFCSLMSELCRNGGSCVMDEDTCIASCICVPGWSGRWCRDEIPMVTSRPGSELQALDDDNNTVTVLPRASSNDLDPTGTKSGDVKDSDTSIQTNETKSFQIHTEKMTEPEEMVIDSNKGMDDNISNVLHDVDAANVDLTSNDVTECLKTCLDGDCIDKDGQYICTRRIEISQLKGPKECQPGFVCQHGVCDMESLDKGLKCICEPNYIGTFCEMECPFDCGDNGVCDYHVDDNQLKCFCQWNYTGLNCTELIPLPPGRLSPLMHI